ncbi:MAG TPA: RHS repeat-associated core domain-containing protein [Candidatus Acidoferrales bacterium]|nr:RHS repeat-associated core domain-containing protein [Candidatus Acidoferrales bacterium]
MTDLPHYRARYYSPDIGRFISEDPIGFVGSGTNFYAYVRNSPVNLTDPFGLCGQKKTNLECLKDAALNNLIPMIADATGTIPGEGQALAVAQAILSAYNTAYSLASTNGKTSNVENTNTITGIVTPVVPVNKRRIKAGRAVVKNTGFDS